MIYLMSVGCGMQFARKKIRFIVRIGSHLVLWTQIALHSSAHAASSLVASVELQQHMAWVGVFCVQAATSSSRVGMCAYNYAH